MCKCSFPEISLNHQQDNVFCQKCLNTVFGMLLLPSLPHLESSLTRCSSGHAVFMEPNRWCWLKSLFFFSLIKPILRAHNITAVMQEEPFLEFWINLWYRLLFVWYKHSYVCMLILLMCVHRCVQKEKKPSMEKRHHNEKYVPVNLLAAASDVGIHSSEEQWNMAEELFLMGRKNWGAAKLQTAL